MTLDYLIITGERRSGTTMIANFLNEQKGVTLFRDYLHIDTLMKRMGIGSLDQNLSENDNKVLIEEFGKDCDKLGMTLPFEKNHFSSLQEFYSYALESVSISSDVIVGHKITMAHEIIGDLLDTFPNIKTIFVIRDPRDMVVSAVKMFKNKNTYEYVDKWSSSYGYIMKCMKKPSMASRITIIKYEDFVLNTQQKLLELKDFLGLSELSVPETIKDYGKDWGHNSSFNKSQKNQSIRTDSIGTWKKREYKTGRTAEALLSNILIREGYQISTSVKLIEKVRHLINFGAYRVKKFIKAIHHALVS